MRTKVTAAIIERDGKVLVARRKPGLRYGGLWEFPGGKLEEGEALERGLERELEEELGVRAKVGEFLCAVPFSGPALDLELLAFRAELESVAFVMTDHSEVLWLSPDEMDEALFTAPDRAVVRRLAGRGPGGEKR